MKCAIEIVSLFSFDLSEYEPCGFATTFYGELMDGSHEFADRDHVRNFIRKVFSSYNFVSFEVNDGLLCALITETEDYEHYSTDGWGYDMAKHIYREVF